MIAKINFIFCRRTSEQTQHCSLKWFTKKNIWEKREFQTQLLWARPESMGCVELQSIPATKNTDIRNPGFKLGCAQKKVAISDSAWERIFAKNWGDECLVFRDPCFDMDNMSVFFWNFRDIKISPKPGPTIRADLPYSNESRYLASKGCKGCKCSK